MPSWRAIDRAQQLRVIAHDRGERAGAVLRLGEEVEREHLRVRVARRDDDELAWTLKSVDADVGRREPLRRRRVRVTRADDLVDTADRGGAVCQRGDRRGAARAIEGGR